MVHDDVAEALASGRTALGIELGSTRIKACLVAADGSPIATGSHTWENALVEGTWTYGLDAVEAGLQDCYARLVDAVETRYGVRPTTYGALGVSAMMHGYLALDGAGELLVPFRTWRNTSTGRAAAVLTEELGHNVPLRWSAAHAYQAVLDGEPHVAKVATLTTLAGYVHHRLTGRSVLGVGDASGMLPVDPATHDYDSRMLRRFDELAAEHGTPWSLRDVLPQVLVAGQDAGSLTTDGARWLDPTGSLSAGIPLCPPEGDAGTGMVATQSVAPRTGNVSVGTSVFAMIVLERALDRVHTEIDVVTTPAGDPVAMVHCNNGASELAAWAGLFGELVTAIGSDADASTADTDEVYRVLFRAALDAEPDAGGLLAYNYLAGEPVTGLDDGRPLVVRTPGSRLTLANFARAQISTVFATLALGMRALADEGVTVDGMVAHGGVFRTEGAAQRIAAAALGVPVTVGSSAGEGGAWGVAVLAGYLAHADELDLDAYLDRVFASARSTVVDPEPDDVAGFATYLARFESGLEAERAAVASLEAR